MKLKYLLYVLIGQALCFQAQAIVLTVSSEDGQYGEDIEVSAGDEISLHLNTNNQVAGEGYQCELSIELAGSGYAARIAELVTSQEDDAVRPYRVLYEGRHYFHLSNCKNEAGEYVDGYAMASVNVPSAAVTGRCGSAHGQTAVRYPSEPHACSAGSHSATDTQGSDGDYNWQCLGEHGGASASCSAVKYVPPPPTDEAASFEGQVRKVWFRTYHDLQWDWPNASSCEAYGDWEGPMPTQGELSIEQGLFNQGKTYGLRCSGAGGIASLEITL